MSYTTIKWIKGNPYLYEVRSEREGDRVRQVFVRYLGRYTGEMPNVTPVAREEEVERVAPIPTPITEVAPVQEVTPSVEAEPEPTPPPVEAEEAETKLKQGHEVASVKVEELAVEPEVKPENVYLKMPIERVRRDARHGVKLAKEALELREGEVEKEVLGEEPTEPEPTPDIDSVLRGFEEQQKAIQAKTRYGVDVTKATEAEFVKAGLDETRDLAKELGFGVDIKGETVRLKGEYAKLKSRLEMAPEPTKKTAEELGDIWNTMTPIQREELGLKSGLDAEQRGKHWIEMFPGEKRAIRKAYETPTAEAKDYTSLRRQP